MALEIHFCLFYISIGLLVKYGVFMAKNEICSNDEFEALLSKYDYNFKKGDLVNGVVSGYDSNGALVDIGAKNTASVSYKEAVSDNSPIEQILEKGKKYEFLIISDEDDNGRMQLSSLKVQQAYTWKELEKVKDADEIILGEVSSIVKGGLMVMVSNIKGFVPSSQLKNKEQEYNVGDKIELKILTLDASQSSFILSNKKVYSETSEEEVENIFNTVEQGQVVKGEVVRMADFGAFVDIGGVDGLLPLSQISWKWIDHPSDLLNIGDKIEVEIISIDKDKKRISLSLKSLVPDPWIEAEKNIKEGELTEGIITRIKPFGAFVEVYPGVEALLSQNELIAYENENNKIPVIGDKINTYILKFNPQDRRIALGIKQPELTEV